MLGLPVQLALSFAGIRQISLAKDVCWEGSTKLDSLFMGDSLCVEAMLGCNDLRDLPLRDCAAACMVDGAWLGMLERRQVH